MRVDLCWEEGEAGLGGRWASAVALCWVPVRFVVGWCPCAGVILLTHPGKCWPVAGEAGSACCLCPPERQFRKGSIIYETDGRAVSCVIAVSL